MTGGGDYSEGSGNDRGDGRQRGAGGVGLRAAGIIMVLAAIAGVVVAAGRRQSRRSPWGEVSRLFPGPRGRLIRPAACRCNVSKNKLPVKAHCTGTPARSLVATNLRRLRTQPEPARLSVRLAPLKGETAETESPRVLSEFVLDCSEDHRDPANCKPTEQPHRQRCSANVRPEFAGPGQREFQGTVTAAVPTGTSP